MWLEMISTLSAGLFAGAAIYINLVEHPARMECGTVLAVTEFAPSYHRATYMQAGLAAVGFLSAARSLVWGCVPLVAGRRDCSWRGDSFYADCYVTDQ